MPRGRFARGARKRSRKMSAEIVVETWDIGKHRNAYRGERALVCAVIEDVLEEIQYERVDRNIHGRHDIKDKIFRERKIKMLKNNIRYLKSSEFRELCEFVDLPAERIRRLYLPMAREKLKRLMGE